MSPPHKQERVVIIAPSAPPSGAGGVANAHYQLYRCFKHRGLDAILLTFNEQGNDISESDIIRFGASSTLRSFLSLSCSIYLKFRGSCRQAYQLNDIIASIPGVRQLNKTLRHLNPEHIIIPDHGAPGLFLDKGNARLTLVTHHNPSRFNKDLALGDYCPVDIHDAISLEQRVLKKVDGVIAPSRYMEGVFRETFHFDGPVTMIHNPVDLMFVDEISKNDVRAELGLPIEAPLVYIPSAGSRLKGACYVAQIIRSLAGIYRGKLGFYLSGGISKELMEVLHGLPQNVRVFSPGHLDYASNLALIKACSFGVSPTLIESFGMSILEANLCGVPMVVFRVGGTGEIIVDGLNGFCVPCHDINSLCSTAEQFLNVEFCKKMGDSACRYSRQYFETNAIIDRYLAFCHIGIGY
ncbi:glycosyltransferase family 4 protein [Geobacter sp. AOG1]|uniref:glycosyltransferase family 4 protein n=1 Tax=Geobacter sp. AOG1 TaxID=1566346 RepID=UPI001CC3C8A7|nr:glycosyltransferase family 4 protein [Geobacter sp. AOG1]GFE58491.1 hypothetical protein AOG1_23710 [Geobacter sp. AOG1]